MLIILFSLVILAISSTTKDSKHTESNAISPSLTNRTIHSLAAFLGHDFVPNVPNKIDNTKPSNIEKKIAIEDQSIQYFISAISKLLGINEPQNRVLGQLHLALASRGKNNLATGILAYAYQHGLLGYPKTDTVAHFLYHNIIDAWANGIEHAYPYEYSNVEPLQIVRLGSKHESEAMSLSEREFMLDEAGLNPESGQALLVLSCFLTGDFGFPRSNLFLARYAAIAAIVDGTGQNEEPGIFNISRVNTKLQKYLNPSGIDDHPDGFYKVIDTIPSLDLYKYKANLALSDHAYIEAIVQIVRASEALLISEYPDLFGLPSNITYSEYLSHPEYNIKTSNSSLIREAIKIYLRQSRHLVPFVSAIHQDLERRVNVSYEEYVDTLIHSPWLVRSPQETCTRRGQAFGIVASSLFNGYSVPDEYASSTFILQATRILYLMAVHDGCHMGLAGLAYQALMGFRMPVEDYIHYDDANAHMYPVTHYLNLSSTTLYNIGTRSFIPARLVGFTAVKRITDLDLVIPRTLEAVMALDIASISGSFESSFYLSTILSRKVSDFSVRVFGLNYLWNPSVVELIRYRFKQLNTTVYKDCTTDILDLYDGIPVNIQFANYLANHSASVGHLGGQIASGYYLYSGQGNQFANYSHGNSVWNVAARRIVVRDYVSRYAKFLAGSKNSKNAEKRLLLSVYLANGMFGCLTSLKNAVKMILGSPDCRYHHRNEYGQHQHPNSTRVLVKAKDRCLLPDLVMYGNKNVKYTGKQARVYLAATLLSNFCGPDDPGCAVLMAKTIKMDFNAAVDALLRIDLKNDDTKTIGTALYNLVSFKKILMHYYLKHRLGATSPKYRNITLLRDIGLVRHAQELTTTTAPCLLCKVKDLHTKLVRYYTGSKESYKHVMGINKANIVTIIVSCVYNSIGYLYTYIDTIVKLIENNVIKQLLRILDLTASLIYIKVLEPVCTAAVSMLKMLSTKIVNMYKFALKKSMLTKNKGKGKDSIDLDLRTRILDADDGPLTVQGSILGGNYGSTPKAMASIPRQYTESARLFDSCYMIPYLLAHHGSFNGSQELLDEHLKDLPYCLQLTSILSSESAHSLMSIYEKGSSKRQLTEFTEQDLHQYLLELDNAFLNIQLHYKIPTINYLFNYVKGTLVYQRPELGYETRRNKDFRNMLSFQMDEFLSLFADPSVLTATTSLSEFRILTQAAVNKLASMASADIKDTKMSTISYPQIVWDYGLDFDWQLLNGIRYASHFTVQTLVIVVVKLKQHITLICTILCALYYLILYDSTFVIFKNHLNTQ